MLEISVAALLACSSRYVFTQPAASRQVFIDISAGGGRIRGRSGGRAISNLFGEGPEAFQKTHAWGLSNMKKSIVWFALLLWLGMGFASEASAQVIRIIGPFQCSTCAITPQASPSDSRLIKYLWSVFDSQRYLGAVTYGDVIIVCNETHCAAYQMNGPDQILGIDYTINQIPGTGPGGSGSGGSLRIFGTIWNVGSIPSGSVDIGDLIHEGQ